MLINQMVAQLKNAANNIVTATAWNLVSLVLYFVVFAMLDALVSQQIASRWE